MAEKVDGRTFYHVNIAHPYSGYPLLTTGQTLKTDAPNPFFQFFDTHPRIYPVTKPEGTVEPVGGLAFLKRVREGSINPNNLPVTAVEVAEHFYFLARELLLENVRLKHFADEPSRMKAIWLVDDFAGLKYWRDRIVGQNTDRPCQCFEVIANGTILRCDARLIPGADDRYGVSEANAKRYWAGQVAAERPEPEVLFNGILTVGKAVTLI